MSQAIRTYIADIQQKFDTGGAREHTYRAPLETLLLSLSDDISVVNEHERVVGVGMPDLTIKDRKNPTITIGWIEAKDLHIDLDEKKNPDQLNRYLGAFDNFVYTNNLSFVFYKDGKKIDSVVLGECNKKSIQWHEGDLFNNNMDKLHLLLTDFLSYQGQTIRSPEKLARAMAQKAKLIKYAIQDIFAQQDTTPLRGQYQSFKDLLIHDLSESDFADMYAQTVAYGLFAARLHDPTLPTFSREEAEKLIPKSTPFIRWLFKQMSNDDEFDDRIAYIIDELVNIFLHCDVAEILSTYGHKTHMHDPIIHFYETFLGEYDAKMRKARGVYYTPEPVVQFIVRGVDYLLQKEFGLPLGLADTSKIEAEFRTQGHDARRSDGIKKEKKMVHRVQVLDPATGTGTFLNEVIHYIHETYFTSQPGARDQYVTSDLLPRIRGFEILMASYTMAHLKLGITLGELGRSGDDRVNIYLTNSLEEPHDHLGTLFSQALAAESEQASKVKREQPIMVVIGNPPYSGESTNKGEWIMSLMEDYKKEPGGKHKLQEQNSKFINDDYVKFIRFAESFVEKNNEGIIAYICPHGFLDNPTFRGMRWKLLSTFDKIFTIDLHGNSKKKETAPDGSKDENVFDIQQGVAITFFVKTNQKSNNKLATVYHSDLYGCRDNKYSRLQEQQLDKIKFTTLENVAPNYFMVEKDFELYEQYKKYISIKKLFQESSLGILSKKDKFITDLDFQTLKHRLNELQDKGNTNKHIVEKYGLKYKDNDKRNLQEARDSLQGGSKNENFKIINYRLFEKRYIYYDKNFVARLNIRVLQHLNGVDNIALITTRQLAKEGFHHCFVSKKMTDQCYISTRTKEGGTVFPLYLYTETIDGATTREPNLDSDLVREICQKLGMSFGHFPDPTTEMAIRRADTDEGRAHRQKNNLLGPEDILDYIYAVLHSPSYRETYAEFLKIDFPRVPFVDDPKMFWQLVELGHQIRQLHLMEEILMSDLQTKFLGSGDSIVAKIGKKSYHDQQVRINDSQYFDGVSETAWNFYIGGYQPAQKWLKDRKGRELSFEDVIHYQKIIYILDETDRLMKEIDTVEFL